MQALKNRPKNVKCRILAEARALALLERSRRTPGQYVSKLFKTWLNKRRKDPRSVGERVAQQDPVLAPAPTLMRLERRERSLGTFAEIIPEPLELEI